jgi:hypothetical protein
MQIACHMISDMDQPFSASYKTLPYKELLRERDLKKSADCRITTRLDAKIACKLFAIVHGLQALYFSKARSASSSRSMSAASL